MRSVEEGLRFVFVSWLHSECGCFPGENRQEVSVVEKHSHEFKAKFASSELAFYECSCKQTRGSNWRGD